MLFVEDRASSGGLVRTLRLSRPDRRNALDPEHLGLLRTAVDAASADPRVRVVILAGDGVAFSSGYDLGSPFPEGQSVPDEIVVDTMIAVRSCAVPVIAKVHGAAFGAGLELAISADFRLAADTATFCLPPAKLGIAYAPAGLGRLASIVGAGNAKRLAFTAEIVDATRALRIGLVDELFAGEALHGAVEQLADTIASMAPLAVRAMKRTFLALEPKLDADADRVALADRLACYASADAAEGLLSFRARRRPVFKGNS